AARIDVLDAHQKPATAGTGPLIADERGQRMAQVQLAVGARCKAEDGFVHGNIAGNRGRPQRSPAGPCGECLRPTQETMLLVAAGGKAALVVGCRAELSRRPRRTDAMRAPPVAGVALPG